MWVLLPRLGDLHFRLRLLPYALRSQADQFVLVQLLLSLDRHGELTVGDIWSLLRTVCALVSYRRQLDRAEDVFAIFKWRLEHLDLVGLLVHA